MRDFCVHGGIFGKKMHDFRGKRGLFWVEMRYFPATSGVFGKEVQDFLRGRWYFPKETA